LIILDGLGLRRQYRVLAEPTASASAAGRMLARSGWFPDGRGYAADERRANQTSSAGQRLAHSSGSSGKSLLVAPGGT
jgi:hypothetical protein